MIPAGSRALFEVCCMVPFNLSVHPDRATWVGGGVPRKLERLVVLIAAIISLQPSINDIKQANSICKKGEVNALV